MFSADKSMWLALLLSLVACALVTSTNALESVAAGIALYATSVLLLAKYIGRLDDPGIAIGVFELLLVFTCLGLLLGVLLSQTLLSAITALSVLLVALTYTMIIKRAH